MSPHFRFLTLIIEIIMAGVSDYLAQFVGPSGGETVNAPLPNQAQPNPAAQTQISNAAGDPTQALLQSLDGSWELVDG